jgi:adenylate kinase
MRRRIILLGPPGSGKGTIAASLEKEFKLLFISSGHLLREEVERGSPAGRRAKQFLDKGELVADEIVLEVMQRCLNAARIKGGFVLDGFPRNLGQARVLDQWLENRGAPLECVLFFDAAESVLTERLMRRRSCPHCGRIYHETALPPKVEGVCDACRTPLVQRSDDTEPVIRRRFQVYRRDTQPLVHYYRRQNKLTSINAALPFEERISASAEALMK